MRWLWKPFGELQEALVEDVAPGEISAFPTPSKSSLRPKQLNDHVYEIHKPEGMPSVELVFFHGLQLDPGSTENAHMSTWVTRDKSESWLTWILEDSPEARILTISYDAAARTTELEGRGDMYVTGENLVYSLTSDTARVGQSGCPVVFVGHCLGGLVIKEICCQAFHIISPAKPVENLLSNLKGLLFYATPHHGSLLADSNKKSLGGPLSKSLEILEVHTARRNEEFRQLRMLKGWKTFGVGELLPVKLKIFEGIMVPEASARSDMDVYYAATVDHYNICRPINKQSSTYQILLAFINQLVKEQTEEQDFREWTIPDSPRASGDSLLGPDQIFVLSTVRYLVYAIHFLLSPLIFFASMSFGMSSKMDPKNSESFEEMSISFAFSFMRTIVLLALNYASAVFMARGCTYLLTICMTKTWAQFLQGLSSTEVKVDEFGSELEVGSVHEENPKIFEFGHLHKEKFSKVGAGFRHQDAEPLLLEQQSEVEVDPLAVPGQVPSGVETQIDVYPSSDLSKQPKRVRSRGANTNKIPIL